MQNEPPFFRSEDLFVISGDQISRIAYLARQQCGAKANEEQIRGVLKEVLENKLNVPQKKPSVSAEPKIVLPPRRGFEQGDPIEKLDDTPFSQGDPIEKLR